MRPRNSRKDPHAAYRFVVESPSGDTQHCKTEDEAVEWAKQEAEDSGDQTTIYKLVAAVKVAAPKPTEFNIEWVEG